MIGPHPGMAGPPFKRCNWASVFERYGRAYDGRRVVGQRKAKALGRNLWTFAAPVKFGGGLLGHLDTGGHFYVEQEEVQPG
jgi:hypothetical protein